MKALPLGIAYYMNRARPEGATLSIVMLCSKDTGLSRGLGPHALASNATLAAVAFLFFIV